MTSSWTIAQTVMTFQEMDKNGLSMVELDSIYHNALNPDTALSVFKGQNEKEFTSAWGNYFDELFQFFKDNNFKWSDTTYCFNKIYFSSNGQVDYWFFNFKKSDNIPQDKQDNYLQLIKKFCMTNKIKITAERNFSQCSSVDFFDNY